MCIRDRPTAVVGGPAYFTPQGYNAPPQPTEAFMPTDVRPDPIGQQFMRQMESPMGQQFQAQYEATQAPMREAEMARRAEEQAAQDARFQELMDRIAELEGQLAQPEPMPEPSPYIPGQTPFPGIPDFIRNLDFSNIDFSNIPGLSNFDYDDIMRQYNDRMEMGEPEPVESFLPDPRDLPPIGLNPPPGGFEGPLPGPKRDAGAMFPPAPKSYIDVDGNLRFGDMPITTMPVGPRGPGMSIEDMLEGRVTTMPVGDPVRLSPEAVRDIIERREEPITRREEPRLMPMPVREPEPAPVMKKVFAEGPTKRIDNTLPDFLEKYRNSPESIENFTAPVMPRISMPKLPNFQSPVVPTPAPRPIPQPIAAPAPAPRQEPIYIPPVMVPNIPKIPNIPNIDFSNLPKFDLPTTGGRPMIPNFGNINLR